MRNRGPKVIVGRKNELEILRKQTAKLLYPKKPKASRKTYVIAMEGDAGIGNNLPTLYKWK
jgi:hypothetical protein